MQGFSKGAADQPTTLLKQQQCRHFPRQSHKHVFSLNEQVKKILTMQMNGLRTAYKYCHKRQHFLSRTHNSLLSYNAGNKSDGYINSIIDNLIYFLVYN